MTWLGLLLALLPILLEFLGHLSNRRRLSRQHRARLQGLVAQVRGMDRAGLAGDDVSRYDEAVALVDDLEALLTEE